LRIALLRAIAWIARISSVVLLIRILVWVHRLIPSAKIKVSE
jgi:hypothetical protein